jgi:hypothetical protein
MANFKWSKDRNAFPEANYNNLIETDPQIVKVPMDNVDFGSRKGTIAKARNPDSGGNGRMGIKHVGKD